MLSVKRPVSPSILPWVEQFAALIPKGEVLDLACGGGRHGRHLLNLGHKVTFLDRDISRLSDLAGEANIIVLEHDLERKLPWPFAANQFSGIVVANYLYRPLLPHLYASLCPDGVLIYYTFAEGNEVYGKPSNPNFLLRQNELLSVFGACMDVIKFQQGFQSAPDRVVQGICAKKGSVKA